MVRGRGTDVFCHVPVYVRWVRSTLPHSDNGTTARSVSLRVGAIPGFAPVQSGRYDVEMEKATEDTQLAIAVEYGRLSRRTQLAAIVSYAAGLSRARRQPWQCGTNAPQYAELGWRARLSAIVDERWFVTAALLCRACCWFTVNPYARILPAMAEGS